MTEDLARGSVRACPKRAARGGMCPTEAQAAYLRRGLDQPGGKLALFDRNGQRYRARTIRSCIALGWAEPWFHNPTHPDWLVCKLTDAGRAAIAQARPDGSNVVILHHFARPKKTAPESRKLAKEVL